MMKLQLKVIHRLTTIAMLNGIKGIDLQSLNKILKVVERLELTKEEIEAIDLKQDGDKLVWKSSDEEPKEIELSDDMADKLKEILKKKSDEKDFCANDKPLMEVYEQLEKV